MYWEPSNRESCVWNNRGDVVLPFFTKIPGKKYFFVGDSFLAKQYYTAADLLSLPVPEGEFCNINIHSCGLFDGTSPSGARLIGGKVVAIEHQVAPAIKYLKPDDAGQVFIAINGKKIIIPIRVGRKDIGNKIIVGFDDL